LEPSTEGTTGSLEAGASEVRNGNEVGYNFRGSVNVPVSDSVAVRASAFTHNVPGFIDNPMSQRNGVNEETVSGGRLSGLWRISDAFSLRVSALYQRISEDGVNIVTPGLGDLQQNVLQTSGDGTVQAYSATVTGTLGGLDLTSLSGYNIRDAHEPNDYSVLF